MIEVKNLKHFEKDDQYCRYSEGSFMRLNNGDIMFICTRFKGERANDNAPADLVKYITADNGKTWTEPEVVFKGYDFGVVNIMSVSLSRLNNGDIGILFIVKSLPSWITKVMFARSSDEGKTWSTPFNTLPFPYSGKMGVNNSRLLKMSTGRLIYPMHIHGGTNPAKYDNPNYGASRYTSSTAVYSDDDGKTWSAAEDYACPTFTRTNTGLQEGHIWEINPGILKVIWRTDKMYQYESVSLDGGIHWSVPTPSCFTGTPSPITIVRNDFNDKIFAMWNPTPNYNRNGPKQSRTPLVIAEVNKYISEFKNLEQIENDPTRHYCYMSGIFVKEDEMLVAYTSGKLKLYGGLGPWSSMTISSIRFIDQN